MRRRERLSCAVGNIFNDIVRQLLTSFQILFLLKVVELPASQVATILIASLLSEGVFSVLNGYLGDRINIPFISRKIGRRKSWHLMATCLMAISLPLLFNRCLLCDGRAQTWLPAFYYSFLGVLKGLSYNMVEVNHLAFITTVAKNVEEATALSTLRTLFTFLSGFYAYTVAWVLLQQDNEDGVGPKDNIVFAKISWIATGTGLMFAVIFYTSPKEPEKRFRRRSTFLDLTNVPVMFTPLSEDDQNPRKNSISHLFVNSIMASSSFEQIEREGGNENPSRSSYERKRSMVQRFLHAVFDEDESNADKNQLENDVAKTSEISPDLDINACIAARVKNLDRGRKKSLVVRVFDGILARMENDQPKECEDQPVSDNVDADVNGKVTLKDSESEWKFEDGEKLDFDINKDYEDEEQGDYQKDQTKGIVESSVLTAPKSRRHGVTLMPHMKQLSMSHLAHEDDDKCKKADGCVSDTSRHPRALKKSVAFMLPESPVLNEKQLELNPIESDKTQTTTAFERSQDHPETHGTENKGFEPCEEVDEEENGGTTDLPVPCKTPRERKRSKTLKDWLKDPNLYKVAAIFTFCRLAQGSVYAFMALYLIEKLEFPKEASAYFPLVLLTGATSSSFICGKLIRKIGSKWSFVLAGSVVMAGAVWSYFQTPATRQLTYVPVAMIGSGLSVMYVMALAFIAELLGEDKESSGSVISIINMIAAVSTSLLAFALQRLYPDNETSSQEEIGDYVRDAFAMASGIPTLMGVLVVLLFQPSRFTCKSKALRDVEAQEDDRVSQCSSEASRHNVEAEADQCVSQQSPKAEGTSIKPSVNLDKTQNPMMVAISSSQDTKL